MHSFLTRIPPLTHAVSVGLLAVCFCSSFSYGQGKTASHPQDVKSLEPPSAIQAQTETADQLKQAESNAKESLVEDAVAAINETKQALNFLTRQQDKEALTAIEKATGKIDILLARHPEKALLAVNSEVIIVDSAPTDIKAIRKIASAAKMDLLSKDFPSARLLLDKLRSEIRIRIHHLPLATYPEHLKNAARLLEEKKRDEAVLSIEEALKTLVIMDQAMPLPIMNAKVYLVEAEEKREKDKDNALRLVRFAADELERGKELGYTTEKDHQSLRKDIQDIERKVQNKTSQTSTFDSIKEKLTLFFKRHGEPKKQR